eukprot:s2591_g14.t1
MPSEGSEVAADHSATDTPVGAAEASEVEERVEQEVPRTSAEVADARRNWADLSEEELQATVPTADAPSSIDVKEEEETEVAQAQSLGAVYSAIGISEVVADEPVATEEASSSHCSGQDVLQTAT